MKVIRYIIGIGLTILALGVLSGPLNAAMAHGPQEQQDCAAQVLGCPNQATMALANNLESFAGPSLTPPEKPAPPAASGHTAAAVTTVTYEVATRGAIVADLATFKQQANQTLNDGRGWTRLGVQFAEVASGGQFTLVLAEAGQMPTFSSGCDAQYSCAVGRYVIINQDRWQGATPSWNNAGGSLRDYRHMVVNHETGHWLGHGHSHCAGAGQPAAVMQQQSIDLQGCTFNPWPLSSELWSSRLGI